MREKVFKDLFLVQWKGVSTQHNRLSAPYREQLLPRLEEVLASRTRDEWRRHFEEQSATFSHAPINSVTEAFELPQVSVAVASCRLMTIVPPFSTSHRPLFLFFIECTGARTRYDRGDKPCNGGQHQTSSPPRQVQPDARVHLGATPSLWGAHKRGLERRFEPQPGRHSSTMARWHRWPGAMS